MHRSVGEPVPNSPQPLEDVSFSERLANWPHGGAITMMRRERTALDLRGSAEDEMDSSKCRTRKPCYPIPHGHGISEGCGCSNDHEEAVKWYRKAADQGYPVAQASLGFMYVMGWGVSKDYKEAVKWYRKAADRDYAVAQTSLGSCMRKARCPEITTKRRSGMERHQNRDTTRQNKRCSSFRKQGSLKRQSLRAVPARAHGRKQLLTRCVDAARVS